MKITPLTYLKGRITRILTSNKAVEETMEQMVLSDRKRTKTQIALNIVLSLILVLSSAIVVIASREAAAANRNYQKLLSAFGEVQEANNDLFVVVELQNNALKDLSQRMKEIRTWEYNTTKDMIELKRQNCELKKALGTEPSVSQFQPE